jgi:nicotinamide mononucleotide (NMN) deamidase PncC
MPERALQKRIEHVHASGRKLVISITGGGSRAIASLLELPGASASVLEGVVPYAAAALEKWLGGPVDHFCSERTARAMAMAGFERARELCSSEPAMVRGIGATASLATTRPKRGLHRIYVAWQSADTTVAVTCPLAKGERTRAEEEAIACQLILSAVFEACSVDSGTTLEPDVAANVERREQLVPEPWTELLLGKRTSLKISQQPTRRDTKASGKNSSDCRPVVLFPGAFNPLHTGHERMAELASERFGLPAVFELSITNVDKPPLDFIELADRLRGLSGHEVLLTRTPTFAEKARLVPGAVFVVGVDTLSRIADPRYYGGETARRDADISTIAEHGCRFLVFGRIKDDQFVTCADLDLPPVLRQLCSEVPESTFRADVSSTKLRNR